MTTSELIELLRANDPEGSMEVKIDAFGLRGGIGNSWANLPTIRAASTGFDWEHGQLLLHPSKSLYARTRKKAP